MTETVRDAVAPFAIALAAFYGCSRFLPQRAVNTGAAAAAFAAAFLAGYALLPPWAPLVPTTSWHWLPYLAVAAAAIEMLGSVWGITATRRYLMHMILALLAGWLLVPSWPELHPPRPVWIGTLAGYLFLLWALLDPLPSRLGSPIVLTALVISAAATAVMLAVFISLTFGEVATVATAAISGCAAGAYLVRSHSGNTTRGLLAGYVVIGAGLAYIGYMNAMMPAAGLLLAPAAPLGLWTCSAGPLSRLRGKRATVVRVVVVMLALAIAVWMLYAAEAGM